MWGACLVGVFMILLAIGFYLVAPTVMSLK